MSSSRFFLCPSATASERQFLRCVALGHSRRGGWRLYPCVQCVVPALARATPRLLKHHLRRNTNYPSSTLNTHHHHHHPHRFRLRLKILYQSISTRLRLHILDTVATYPLSRQTKQPRHRQCSRSQHHACVRGGVYEQWCRRYGRPRLICGRRHRRTCVRMWRDRNPLCNSALRDGGERSTWTDGKIRIRIRIIV